MWEGGRAGWEGVAVGVEEASSGPLCARWGGGCWAAARLCAVLWLGCLEVCCQQQNWL
jgi:hypothetical protein